METVRIFIGNVVDYLINPLLVLLMALALAYFLWGGAMFIFNSGGSPEDRKKGKDAMVYGLIGLFIMTSVLGILAVFTNTFGVSLPR